MANRLSSVPLSPLLGNNTPHSSPMLYDEEGRPEKAIGIKEDLSYMPAQQRSVQRRIMPADLYPHLYCYLQANITADMVEKLQLEGRERIVAPSRETR